MRHAAHFGGAVLAEHSGKDARLLAHGAARRRLEGARGVVPVLSAGQHARRRSVEIMGDRMEIIENRAEITRRSRLSVEPYGARRGVEAL